MIRVHWGRKIDNYDIFDKLYPTNEVRTIKMSPIMDKLQKNTLMIIARQ